MSLACVQVSMFLLGYQVYVASMCTGEDLAILGLWKGDEGTTFGQLPTLSMGL